MSWEWLAGLLPLLLLLACPVAMWFMMRGMSGGPGGGKTEDESEAPDAALQREVEALRARVAELEAGTPASRT